MTTITEAMLRSGVFRYGDSTIEQGAGNYWVIRNRQGLVTHRIESATFKSGLIIRDMSTGRTVSDLSLSML